MLGLDDVRGYVGRDWEGIREGLLRCLFEVTGSLEGSALGTFSRKLA